MKKVRDQGEADRKRHVSQRGERGTGLKFKLETVVTVSNFHPGTRIKYGPNPKREGSKSYDRYAGYMKARTVGEALKCGSKLADLLWELERGDYAILKGAPRTEAEEVAAIGRAAYDKARHLLSTFQGPRGCPVKLGDPAAAERLKKEEAWRDARMKRIEAKAKELGLKVETTAQIAATTESADVRLQRRVATALAERKLATGRPVTTSDVQEVLDCWGYGENVARVNVMPEGQKYVYSDTVGGIRARSFGFGCTPPTWRYPAFVKLLCQWMKDAQRGLKLPCGFVCTAINLNCNYAGRRHVDQNNEGPSIIRAFGKFKGGRLRYWPAKKVAKTNLAALKLKDAVRFELDKKTVVFDGKKPHEVEDFEGDRYSIVFFTAKGWAKSKGKDREFLVKSCGVPFPTPKALNELKNAGF